MIAGYTEKEIHNIWSKMPRDDQEYRLKVMEDLFLISYLDALAYDKKFSNERDRQIWENSHPLECSKISI